MTNTHYIGNNARHPVRTGTSHSTNSNSTQHRFHTTKIPHHHSIPVCRGFRRLCFVRLLTGGHPCYQNWCGGLCSRNLSVVCVVWWWAFSRKLGVVVCIVCGGMHVQVCEVFTVCRCVVCGGVHGAYVWWSRCECLVVPTLKRGVPTWTNT